MIFFSIGLPSRFADWCDAVLRRLVEHHFGAVQSASLNSLEELAQVVIRSGALQLVACSRQPVVRLQSEVVQSGHPFLVALGDPRAALRALVDATGCTHVDAARAVASSCAGMLNIATAPNALVLTPAAPGEAAAAISVIAEHFHLAIDPGAVAGLAEELAAALAAADRQTELAWWEELPPREQLVIGGALEPYLRHFAGAELERLIWEPELFYTLTDPPAPSLIPAAGAIDITGRSRYLVYGPFINLPPGSWSVDVVVGFSPEAAGMSFLLEVFAGVPLAHTRVEPAGGQVIETRLQVQIGDGIDQPVQIRLVNERSAFDGRLALGYVAITRQPTIPEETRQRLADALHR